MKYLLLISLFLLPYLTNAQISNEKRKQDVESSRMQSNEIELIKKNIELSNSINAQSSASVSNMLGSINTIITIFGIFISIALIFAGYFFTNILNKVGDIEKSTQTKLNEIIQIDQKLRELQDNINNNINKIYKDIKHQELNTLLNLIIDKPNLFKVFESSFMGIDIPRSYFNKFYILKKNIDLVHDTSPPLEQIQYRYSAFMFCKFPLEMISTEEFNYINLIYSKKGTWEQIVIFILDLNNNIPTRVAHIKSQITRLNPGEKYFEEFVNLLEKDDIRSLIVQPSQYGIVPEHHLARNSFFEQLLKD